MRIQMQLTPISYSVQNFRRYKVEMPRLLPSARKACRNSTRGELLSHHIRYFIAPSAAWAPACRRSRTSRQSLPPLQPRPPLQPPR